MTAPERGEILSDRKIEEALGGLQRAVAACQFYPASHPLLDDTIRQAFELWRVAEEDYRWREPGLQLRSGKLWLGDQELGGNNPLLGSLARTCSAHGLLRLRRTGHLRFEGFAHLIGLLATTPDVLAPREGIAGAWRRSAHADALELRGLALDAAAARSRPKRPRAAASEWGSGLSAADEAAALSDPLLLRRLQAFHQRGAQERRVLDLLLRLGHTDDLNKFLSLLREIGQLTRRYLEAERYREAFHVVLYLYREAQNMEAMGRAGKRDYLLDTVRLLVKGDFLNWLVGHVAAAQRDEEVEVGEYILRYLGRKAVVPLINALVAETTRAGRRRLVDVLVSVGDPAVPWAVKMLDDQRWYVVRNMLTILGGIGSPEAVKALVRMSRDADARIRKEVARALGRVVSPVAEEELLRLLEDADPTVRRIAVNAAASHRTDRMLQALQRQYQRIGIRSPDWDLAVVIVEAIGRMGIPDGVRFLGAVLGRKRVLHKQRWQAVKRAALQGLAELGGEEARVMLECYREHRSPELRAAAIRGLAALGETAEGAS